MPRHGGDVGVGDGAWIVDGDSRDHDRQHPSTAKEHARITRHKFRLPGERQRTKFPPELGEPRARGETGAMARRALRSPSTRSLYRAHVLTAQIYAYYC